MENTELYPLKFKPILKEKIWGGQNLAYKSTQNKTQNKIGESWEISGVPGDISIVNEGELKGKNLKAILQHYKDELVGQSIFKRFGNEFPLLIKFIDAKENLSVQLHPDDSIAKVKHNCMGKTEMWYILQSEKDGFIITDFNKEMNQKLYLDSVDDKSLKDHLKHIKVDSGDVYFIAPGLIHAIGAGVMLAEIQQTSDITYRIYDWDRVDESGQSRELHQQEALDAIDFAPQKSKINYTKTENTINSVVYNSYFKTDYLQVNKQYNLDLDLWDSFTILINVGKDSILWYNQIAYTFNTYEAYLIPACISNIRIEAENSEFLVVHI